jgi:peroxiredoxin
VDLIVFAAVLPWLLIVFGCWLCFQLVRQNGRLLLRLEALERRQDRKANVGGDGASAPTGLPAGPVERPMPSAPTGMPTERPVPSTPTALPFGSAAPAFELPDLAGNRTALDQFRGRRLLLIFFSPRCGFCRQMVPELTALPQDETHRRPLPVVITTGSAEENQMLFGEHEVSTPVLLDEGGELRAAYLAGGSPMGYLVDEEGRIASDLAVGARELLALAAASPPQLHRVGISAT